MFLAWIGLYMGGGGKGLALESCWISNVSWGLLDWCTILALGVIVRHEYYVIRLSYKIYEGVW